MDERWVPVVGYEGVYEVSDCGRVKRVVAGGGAQIGRVLKTNSAARYPHVQLWFRGVFTRATVHTLVAEAFLGPRPKGYDVNHINANKRDNALRNLEYVTRRENVRKAGAMGLMVRPRGELAPNHRLTAGQVMAMRAEYKKNEVGYLRLAKRYGVSASTVRGIILGEYWRGLGEE